METTQTCEEIMDLGFVGQLTNGDELSEIQAQSCNNCVDCIDCVCDHGPCVCDI